MADLKPFVRDLMRDMEEDLATRLDWVAVDHFNTGHAHTHIVIAGHDDRGQDLVMARHYISHGIRHRAQDLVTLELGPEQQFERLLKLVNEMQAERFTSLDRGIVRDAEANVLVVSAMGDGERGRSERRAESAQLSMRVGRLRRLEQMGLAEQKRTGVWAIDPRLEAKLRSLGERGDIMVTMNQIMRAHGIDRPAGDFAIFARPADRHQRARADHHDGAGARTSSGPRVVAVMSNDVRQDWGPPPACAEREIEVARDYLDSIIATIRQPLVVLDDELRVISASSSFHRIFSVRPDDLIGRHLLAAGHHLDVPPLREFLASI